MYVFFLFRLYLSIIDWEWLFSLFNWLWLISLIMIIIIFHSVYIYDLLKGMEGLPRIYYYGTEGPYNVLVRGHTLTYHEKKTSSQLVNTLLTFFLSLFTQLFPLLNFIGHGAPWPHIKGLDKSFSGT
jgi:hypothetical protein